ncbi:MAG: hypothetical protein WCC01_10680 [Acidimicrobiia bacterium]
MYRHRFDAISFVFGLLFVGMAFLAPNYHWFSNDMARWIVPGAVLLLGAGLAITAIATNQKTNQPDDHSAV